MWWGTTNRSRIRWSDGIETLAEVVRVAKNRDVAIIKTNPRDRDAACPQARRGHARRSGSMPSARRADKNFRARSAAASFRRTRVFDGLRYIQSDTSVSPGSSGGPLLDENGAVIGLTVSGIEGAPRAEFVHPDR